MFQTEETVSIRMDISDYSKEDLFNLIGLFQKYIDNCKISFHDDSFDKLRNKSSDKIILNFIIKAEGLQELNNIKKNISIEFKKLGVVISSDLYKI